MALALQITNKISLFYFSKDTEWSQRPNQASEKCKVEGADHEPQSLWFEPGREPLMHVIPLFNLSFYLNLKPFIALNISKPAIDIFILGAEATCSHHIHTVRMVIEEAF